MKSASFLGVAILLVSLVQATAVAKGTTEVGIYAVIDQVTFDQNGSSPDLVRISGLFVVPVPMSNGEYREPQRGYLYFRIPRGDEYWTRKEWSRLKALAGTGQVVGFGLYWAPNSPGQNRRQPMEIRVRTGSDTAAPDIYPFSYQLGIVQAGAPRFDPRFSVTIAAKLQKSSN